MTDPRAMIVIMSAALCACSDDRRPGTPDDPEGGVLSFDGSMIAWDASSPPRDAPGRDGATAGDSGSTDGGTDPAADRRYFVPDFPNTYDGPIIEPGAEVYAHTIREGFLGDLEFLIAVRNTSGLKLCAVDVTTTFFDAGGAQIARTSGLIENPMYRGVSGTGSLLQCFGLGEVGMQSSTLDLGSRTVDDIAYATWSIGAINLTDAVRSSDLAVTGVLPRPDGAGSYEFIGVFQNRSGATVRYPAVSIFGVNLVGRPLVEASDIDTISVPAGGTWSFVAHPRFEETVADYVAYPDALD